MVVNVLRDFFFYARGDTPLTRVSLDSCNFGSQEDAFAAFISVLNKRNGDGCLSVSGLLENNTTIQRLDCSSRDLRVEGVLALQPGLLSNRSVKGLDLSWCRLQKEAIRQVANGLAGKYNY